MAAIEFLRIEQAKILDYLLNLDHVDGRDEAAFFISRGFAVDAPGDLAEALAAHAAAHRPGRISANAHVTKHIVEGPLACPDGSAPNILAVWKPDPGKPDAWLVTAQRCRRSPAHELLRGMVVDHGAFIVHRPSLRHGGSPIRGSDLRRSVAR